jgi:hypothetical protein
LYLIPLDLFDPDVDKAFSRVPKRLSLHVSPTFQFFKEQPLLIIGYAELGVYAFGGTLEPQSVWPDVPFRLIHQVEQQQRFLDGDNVQQVPTELHPSFGAEPYQLCSVLLNFVHGEWPSKYFCIEPSLAVRRRRGLCVLFLQTPSLKVGRSLIQV